MPVPPVAKHVAVWGVSRCVQENEYRPRGGDAESMADDRYTPGRGWAVGWRPHAAIQRAVASAMSVLDGDHLCFMVCGHDMHAKATVCG